MCLCVKESQKRLIHVHVNYIIILIITSIIIRQEVFTRLRDNIYGSFWKNKLSVEALFEQVFEEVIKS